MKLLNKLTIKNLKLNRKKSIVSIIGIILSSFLITAVSSIYSSGTNSLIDLEKMEMGNFHVAFNGISEKKLNDIKKQKNIENVFTGIDLGYSAIESQNEEKPYAFVSQYDENSLSNLIMLKDGRLPKNDKEILIPKNVIENGKLDYKIGDKIILEIGKRVSQDGNVLSQKQAYNSNELNEKIIETQKYEYTIVGITERLSYKIEELSAPGYTFISYKTSENNETVNGYIRFNKEGLNDLYGTTATIAGLDQKLYKDYNNGQKMTEEEENYINDQLEKLGYQIDYNNRLIMVESQGFLFEQKSLLAVYFIICLIIIITSALCIKNSFEISMNEKTKQYGILRSIGATSKQIKQNVYYEGLVLGTIGIPLGTILGILANNIIIKISNLIIKGTTPSGFVLKPRFSLIAIIFAVILGYVTIYYSAKKSAKMASKVSTIETIKNNSNIKINEKSLKTPKIINKLFGIGGEISYKNLKRNKRKYRTSVLSIIVSVVLFVSLSAFLSQGFEIMELSGGRISAFKVVSILAYGFIAIIVLIGITNIFNTLTTSIELRKPEFAMLKSIGMTTKEFNKMIGLESIFMGIKSLIYGIPIGVMLSFILCKIMAKSIPFDIKFPFTQVIIAILGVFTLIYVIMKYSIGKVNKLNTIETIRNENI